MYQIRFIILTLLIFTYLVPYSFALPDDATLLTIDNTVYTVSDFQRWWQRYRDDNNQKIENIEPYIDFLLLANEAQTMELDTLPEYRRKIDIYVKSRTLMLLKSEEIDSKINLSDEVLYETYLADYVPRRLVALIECESAEAAEEIRRLDEKQLSMSQIVNFQELHKNRYVVHTPQWLRPNTTPDSWKENLEKMSNNSLSVPFMLDDGKTGLLFLSEVAPADDHDFSVKKKAIASKIRKKNDRMLTEKLLISLRKKYNIQINNELLDQIDLFSPDSNILNETVISSTKSTVSVQYLIDQCMRDKQFVKSKNRTDKTYQQEVKNRMVNAMISNSMVSWEALDRNYDKKPPFKWDLQFYKNHRLVRDIEKRLYSEITINDDDIASFYQKNQKDFIQPEKVQVTIIEAAPDTIFKIWSKLLTGGDLLKEAKTLGITGITSLDSPLPLDHFHPETLKVLERLSEGGISSPYQEKGATRLLQLLRRIDSSIEPLSAVKQSIVDTLLEKAKDAKRKEFLDTLKKKYKTVVDYDNWEKLQATVN